MGFIGTVEHWFARVGHEIVTLGKEATSDPQAGQAVIGTAAAVLEAAEPPAALVVASVASGMEAAWGKICAAIHAGQDVAKTGYLQIPADVTFVESVKEAIQASETIKPGVVAVADALKAKTATPAPSTTVPAPAK